MKSPKSPVLIAAVILVVATVGLAQLKVDVALVTVVATVNDDKGRYVSDLQPDDFIVQEDGVTQTISHLAQSNDLPVSVGITLDTSGSMERKINTASNAVERFVRSVHEDDDIFLMTFSNRPVLEQDFTDDREKLSRSEARSRQRRYGALRRARYFIEKDEEWEAHKKGRSAHYRW